MYSQSGDVMSLVLSKLPYVKGEYLVIARDALMRFVKVEVFEPDERTRKYYEDIINSILDFFPRSGGRQDLELRIPMGHRYTKFTYVADDLSIYIPYHYHLLELYGIYFRRPRITADAWEFIKLALTLLKDDRFYERLRISEFTKSDVIALLKHELISLSILLALYFEAVYLHALAHHVVEDLSTWYELNTSEKYSVIKSAEEEEAFCEYVMYRALMGESGWNESKGGFALKLLYRLRDVGVIFPMSPEDMMKFLGAFRSVFAQLLYIHRGRKLYKDYAFLRPAISEDVIQKIPLVFEGLWLAHVYDLEPVRLGLKGQEIFGRIYTIDL